MAAEPVRHDSVNIKVAGPATIFRQPLSIKRSKGWHTKIFIKSTSRGKRIIMEMSMNERIRYYSAEKLEYGDFQNHASADTISCDQGKANSPRKGMTVKEMGDLLGLKKTERYWLVHKNVFETKIVAGKMWVDTSSFE